jgi:exodeoxyribonuclease V alpha subunit
MLAHAKMIIVDECSMVDLGNFTKLLSIIREQCPDARLVLMGDHEQLPSVDTGSVYYDLCSARCLADCKSRLGDNYRLQAQPLEWAKYVHQDAGAKDLSDQLKSPDAKTIIEIAEPIFRNCIKIALQGDDAKALEQIDQLRILCSHKSGKVGVRNLNRDIRKALGLTNEDSPGSLIIVTQNDHLVTGLSNGDVGIVLDNKRVCFPRTKESDTKEASRHMIIGFNQLPPNEPAFATTIHKSQGSEYKHVIVAISSTDDNDGLEEEAGFINRKLVFTGVTRAIERLDVFAKKMAFEKAIEDIFARASGLQDRLDEMSKNTSASK